MSEERGFASTHAWSSSAYPGMAPNLLPAIARLVDLADVSAGERVLDAGCGTGNVALTVSQRGAHPIGFDLTPGMLDLARESAAVVGASPDWVRGDVERLPFEDGAFDVALSSFGHVFAPDAEAAAAELVRVTGSGGRIAFGAWSPYGVVGALAELAAEYVPASAPDPTAHLRWGHPEQVESLLGGAASDLAFRHGNVTFRYVSPAHFWRQVAVESGPLVAAVEQLEDPETRAEMRGAALDRVEEFFEGNAVRAEYLLARAELED